jgi:hypothetical protein
MHILLAVGVTVLTATTPAQTSTPQPVLAPTQPLSVTFVVDASKRPTFEEAISFLARYATIAIELDGSVPGEIREQAVADSTLSMRGVSLEEGIAMLTRIKGLSYSIVDAKTVRIFKKG